MTVHDRFRLGERLSALQIGRKFCTSFLYSALLRVTESNFLLNKLDVLKKFLLRNLW